MGEGLAAASEVACCAFRFNSLPFFSEDIGSSAIALEFEPAREFCIKAVLFSSVDPVSLSAAGFCCPEAAADWPTTAI